MAFGNLLALLDDIASVLDDVAALTKTAAAKTAGVLGDDLALNAQQLSGLAAAREWPVVWAVARGSLLNKAILVPSALALSALAPFLVQPLLMLGGLYLCLEGFEKLVHAAQSWRSGAAPQDSPVRQEPSPSVALVGGPAETTTAAGAGAGASALEDRLRADLAALERDRVKGAIRTDLVLSGEIIVIALGSVNGLPLLTQVLVLVGVSLLMTVGVYGFVAAIVKIDDLGLWLMQRPGATSRRTGLLLLRAAPMLMKVLTWVGTAAMFFVGGGILLHGVPGLHHTLAEWLAGLEAVPAGPATAVAGALAGLLAGALALGSLAALRRLRGASATH